MTSSRSEVEAIETARVAAPSQYHCRRRPGAETRVHCAMSPSMADEICSGSCAITTRSTAAKQDGSRWTA